MSKEVTDATFASRVEQVAGPVLVDFWAPWCGPCRMLAPVLDELEKEWAGKLEIYRLNVDDNPSTAGRFGIMSIPTLLLFKNGQVVQQVIGYQNKARLSATLRPHLS
ncbi:thioredoxin [Kyrpidia spormannii]|uniref:Thioredoxin n=3 Tax=Kyrpidia TaxID=1129704 RepID=A0A2K8N4H4_9BACL|nr:MULTISPECIES: thioredoxin [Kyrpidia]ADG05381.1 thioredoxin [Kyrpidia tusciae DSM 2912]ATY84303.1 thioredoxin [Kyrpidia spormannii]MCL6575569.1 thioredoxin [Kyrpidia sp.]CAB3390891.1 Thioredoxin 1 [Kyrpidia spormannii]CAB3391799.1 Thioredoxin 1 [Kyrpidia spormannii]